MNNDKIREALFHRLDARKYICISDNQAGLGPAIRLSSEERDLILKALASDPWQPIETAPKDGEQILIYYKCIDADSLKFIEPYFQVCARWFNNEWLVVVTGEGYKVSLDEARMVKWQPLPNPPVKKD